MNAKKILFIAGIFLFFMPFSAVADKCDDVVNKASGIYDEARNASSMQDYARAAELFEKAGRYYRKASKMKNCQCPKIESSSRNNVELCRRNVEKARRSLVAYQAVETYNQATAKYNEGVSYANSGQWSQAENAFDDAIIMWQSIDSMGEYGRQAEQAAERARQMSESVRQRI